MLSQQASSGKDPDSEREVFRSPGSAVLSWAWFAVALIILVDLAVQGRDHAALVTAVLVVAITGIVYSCAWRPRIVADSGGITVINPVRDHQVPWAAITKVDVVNAVRVHCAPAPGASRGKILYSWAVQSSPRSARKAALRHEVSGQGRPRLTPRPRSLQPPPGAAPRYGEIPEAARDALSRSTAEFTAGRLAERAQHAHQAASLTAAAPSAAGRAGRPDGGPAGAQPGGTGDGQAAPDAQVSGDAQVSAESRVTGGGQAAGGSVAAADQASAGPGRPSAQWAWPSIAAMIVPLGLLLIVVLI